MWVRVCLCKRYYSHHLVGAIDWSSSNYYHIIIDGHIAQAYEPFGCRCLVFSRNHLFIIVIVRHGTRRLTLSTLALCKTYRRFSRTGMYEVSGLYLHRFSCVCTRARYWNNSLLRRSVVCVILLPSKAVINVYTRHQQLLLSYLRPAPVPFVLLTRFTRRNRYDRCTRTTCV